MVTVPSAGERWPFTVDERSAQLLREVPAATGALVCGRRLSDHTNGWDDRHPVVVVTHRPPRDAGKWATIAFAGRRVHPSALRRTAYRRPARLSLNVSTINDQPHYAGDPCQVDHVLFR